MFRTKKPIAAHYTNHRERANSFVEIYFDGADKLPVKYVKNEQSVSKKKSGTYGTVMPFFRSTQAATSEHDAKVTNLAAPKIAVKELQVLPEKIREEAEHTSIAQQWSAHNLEQSDQSRKFILQPFIDAPRFDEIIYSKMSNFFYDCQKILIAIKAFHADGHIHCDIKAVNVFVGEAASLADCGSSNYLNDQWSIEGSCDYVAPEAWNEKYVEVTANLDIYSTGKMFIDKIKQTKEIQFKWHNSLKYQFGQFCAELASVEPSARPTVEKALLICQWLALLAYCFEEKKYNDSFIRLKMPLEMNLASIEKQAVLEKRYRDLCHSIQQQTGKKSLRDYLLAKELRKRHESTQSQENAQNSDINNRVSPKPK